MSRLPHARVGFPMLAAVSVWACPVTATSAEATVRSFPAAGITAVHVEGGAGSLTIRAIATGEAQVSTKVVQGGEGCGADVTLEGPVLRAKVTGPRGILGHAACVVDVVVTAPATAAVNALAGAGAVTIEGFSGTVGVAAGSGAVGVSGPVKQLTVNTGSGDLTATGLEGRNVWIDLGSGKATLEWALAVTDATATIRSGGGDVALTFPAVTRVATKVKAGSGKVTNEFTTAESGGVLVTAELGSADLVIRRR